MQIQKSQTLKAITLFGLHLSVLMLCSQVTCDANSGLVVGWVERVCVQPGNVVLAAKVDTGAVTCSLHASDVQQFKRDEQLWVRIRLAGEDGSNVLVERPVMGTRRIKRHFGQFQERVVVKLTICIGHLCKEVETSLVDRTGFEYPLLIGRNFMEGDLLVNPSVKFTVEPRCTGVLPQDGN